MPSLKVFTDGYLKQNGIDAHEVKKLYGCKPVSHYDICNGETVTIRDKKGNLFYDTGLSKSEFFDTYAKDQEESKWSR